MDHNYPSNSHKSKAEAQSTEVRKKTEKVVTGTVKTRKKSAGQKLTNIFIAEDAKNVKSYVFLDVLVPAIKDALYNIVCDGAGMILGKPIRGRGSSPSGKNNYTRYYDDPRKSDYRSPRPRTVFEYDDLIFDTRADAEMALDELRRALYSYKTVRVADLYDIAGVTVPSYTYNDYGWTNLDRAEVMRIRDGYIIQLPRPMAFD